MRKAREAKAKAEAEAAEREREWAEANVKKRADIDRVNAEAR